jgi:hypothetical protein
VTTTLEGSLMSLYFDRRFAYKIVTQEPWGLETHYFRNYYDYSGFFNDNITKVVDFSAPGFDNEDVR